MSFSATEIRNTLDYTNQELYRDIQTFIKASFPSNGIEYWTTNQIDDENEFEIPQYEQKSGFHHVSAHVFSGGNEGVRLNVDIIRNDGKTINIASAKSFDTKEESWKMAASISEMIESIYFYHTIVQKMKT